MMCIMLQIRRSFPCDCECSPDSSDCVWTVRIISEFPCLPSRIEGYNFGTPCPICSDSELQQSEVGVHKPDGHESWRRLGHYNTRDYSVYVHHFDISLLDVST